MRAIRIEENHTHAYMIYEPTDYRHFWALFLSFIIAKRNKTFSLTTHLPFEIQHKSKFSKRQYLTAKTLIKFGEVLKKVMKIPLYWENCPIVNVKTWELLYDQTEWENVPATIALCLDTGHLMMNAKNKNEARQRIKTILKERGKQIKHAHIHENNFKIDNHFDPRKRKSLNRIITSSLLKEIQKNRTYIFEKLS